MQCRRFLVSGLVQGVGFRAATAATGRRLGVTGWVRNADDGSVEVVACADETIIATFERWLRQGPPAAYVDAVEVSACPIQQFADFQIRG